MRKTMHRKALLLSLVALLFLSFILVPVHSASKDSSAIIVIAGAGPASLYFAARMLQLDPAVRIAIFEKKPRPVGVLDQGIGSDADDQAFGVGLGPRAQHYLARVPGLSQCIEQVAAVMQPHGTWMVNRQDFCAQLTKKLEAEFGCDRLDIAYNSSVCEVFPDQQSVQVERDDQNTTIPYDILVGADGTNSRVRACLAQQGLIKGKRFRSGSAWKVLQLPPQPAMLSNSMSYKTGRDSGRILPRYPNKWVLLNFRDESLLGESPNPFDASTPEQFRHSLQKHCGNITNLPDDAAIEAFLHKRPGKTHYMRLQSVANPLSHIALIGDASVGMYSLLGQGFASALEQADFLAISLTSGESTFSTPLKSNHLEKAFHLYNRFVAEESVSVADLNLVIHLAKAPIIGQLSRRYLRDIGVTLMSTPLQPYSEMLRKHKWTIRVAKIFWILTRRPEPL